MPEHLRGICWDLDHTLVGFDQPPSSHAKSDPRVQRAPQMVLRPDIVQALERLVRRGYQHFVTTGGTREYAERMLAATDIRQHFSGIFERAEIDAGAGKRYRPVAQSLGLSDEEACKRLIAISDVIYDQPADIDGLVFIHQPNGFRCDGSVVEGVILMLEAAGDSDLLAGFHACLARVQRGAPVPPPAWDAPWLPAGIMLSLELRSPHHPRHLPRLEDIMIPTVRLLPESRLML